MSNSLGTTKDLRCESNKITKSGRPNMATLVMMTVVHVHQINCIPMTILIKITNLVYH